MARGTLFRPEPKGNSKMRFNIAHSFESPALPILAKLPRNYSNQT